MTTEYDTIIIGSGCGGAAAAALMSYHGDKTLLVEKNKLIGGRAALFERDGFKLDHGHILARCHKGPHGEVLRIVDCEDLIPRFSFSGSWPVLSYLGDRRVDIYPNMKQMVMKGKLPQLAKSIDFTLKDMFINGYIAAKETLMTEKQIKRWDNVALKEKMAQHDNNPYINQ